jgi:ferredoxin, 2Fe-2S
VLKNKLLVVVLEIVNLIPTVAIPLSTNQSLLAAAQAAQQDWAHACGGRGRCTTCRITLIAGAEYLTPLTSAEVRFAALGRLPAGSRLACQAQLAADMPSAAELRGAVPLEGQLPHLIYAA